jgi:hypothetical protein
VKLTIGRDVGQEGSRTRAGRLSESPRGTEYGAQIAIRNNGLLGYTGCLILEARKKWGCGDDVWRLADGITNEIAIGSVVYFKAEAYDFRRIASIQSPGLYPHS